MKNITQILLVFLSLCVFAHAQTPQCASHIQKTLDVLKAKGDMTFNFHESLELMEGWAYGNTPAIVAAPLKKKAFLSVFTSMSEVCDLVGDKLSRSGIRGYNKLCGGIIRSAVDRDYFATS